MVAESWREKETAPKENALVRFAGSAKMDWGQGRKLSGNPVADNGVLPAQVSFLCSSGCYSYSPCVVQGSDRRHGGPFIYQWAESASICRIYTYLHVRVTEPFPAKKQPICNAREPFSLFSFLPRRLFS